MENIHFLWIIMDNNSHFIGFELAETKEYLFTELNGTLQWSLHIHKSRSFRNSPLLLLTYAQIMLRRKTFLYLIRLVDIIQIQHPSCMTSSGTWNWLLDLSEEEEQQRLVMNGAIVMILMAVTACAAHIDYRGEGEVRATDLPRWSQNLCSSDTPPWGNYEVRWSK